MLVTLKELQSRIETVRRNKFDLYGEDVLLLLINGQVVDATRESIQIDDTGTMIIQAQLSERVVDCTVAKTEATDDFALNPSSEQIPWRAAFERLRKNQYADHRQVTMFNFSREKMNDAMEVAAAADEAVEWGCRWESLCSAQSELIKKLHEQIKMLSKPAIAGLI